MLFLIFPMRKCHLELLIILQVANIPPSQELLRIIVPHEYVVLSRYKIISRLSNSGNILTDVKRFPHLKKIFFETKKNFPQEQKSQHFFHRNCGKHCPGETLFSSEGR